MKSGKYADQHLSDLAFKSALSWQTSYFNKETLQERLGANNCRISDEDWKTIIDPSSHLQRQLGGTLHAEAEAEAVSFVHDSSW